MLSRVYLNGRHWDQLFSSEDEQTVRLLITGCFASADDALVPRRMLSTSDDVPIVPATSLRLLFVIGAW